MSKKLTQAQAMTAYRRICKHLGYSAASHPVKQTGYHDDPEIAERDRKAWRDGPVLCQNFDDTYPWAIVLEGDYDWPMRASEEENWVRREKGLPRVFVEPINGWSLALYPLED